MLYVQPQYMGIEMTHLLVAIDNSPEVDLLAVCRGQAAECDISDSGYFTFILQQGQ